MLPFIWRVMAIAAVILTSCIHVQLAMAQPINDNFMDAIEVIGDSGTIYGTNVDSTGEPGEPDHWYSVPPRSVWFYWTATSNDMVEFSTSGSGFDTTLAVYTGNSVDQLSLITSNDDHHSLQSLLRFAPIADTTYYIAVDGFSGSQGQIQFNWQLFDEITVSGTVSLPTSTTHTEDIWVTLNFISDDSYLDNHSTYIPAGSTDSTLFTFTITLPKNTPNLSCKIDVDKSNYDPGPEFVGQFYYNETGSVGLRQNASIIDTSANVDLGNIPLLTGNIVSGTISLQEQDTFTANTYIDIMAVWGQEWQDRVFSHLDLQLGDSSVTYSIAVPPDAPDFMLQYRTPVPPPTYLETGYYTATNDGFCDGDIFSNTMDHPDIDIFMLKGYSLKGNVVLPAANEPEPLSVTIASFEDPEGEYGTTLYNYRSTQVTIEPNTISKAYEITIPTSCNETVPNYLVRYRQENANYVPQGYYSDSGTVGSMLNSTPLPADQSHNGVDLELIEGTQISGVISLSLNEGAVDTPLDIQLGTFSEVDGYYHTTVTVDGTAMPYSLRVAQDRGPVVLGFSQGQSSDYANSGYYTSDQSTRRNTTGARLFATQFDPNFDHFGSDFLIPPATVITGEIITAVPSSQPEPLEIILTNDPADPDALYWSTVITVPTGANHVSYTSPGLVLDQPVVMQFNNDTNQVWRPNGFFATEAESVPLLDAASWLPPWQNHGGVNLHLTGPISGDLNADTRVDLIDIILGLQVLAGNDITPVAISADLNGDGAIGLAEILHAMNKVKNPCNSAVGECYSGVYEWNCSVNQQGESPLLINITDNTNGSITGEINYLGSTTTFTGWRCTEVNYIDPFLPSCSGTMSSTGQYISFNVDPTTSFVQNSFFGEFSGASITGQTMNGDSDNGCSHATQSAGTFYVEQ